MIFNNTLLTLVYTDQVRTGEKDILKFKIILNYMVNLNVASLSYMSSSMGGGWNKTAKPKIK